LTNLGKALNLGADDLSAFRQAFDSAVGAVTKSADDKISTLKTDMEKAVSKASDEVNSEK
jgi:hypothetical protein